MRTAEQQRKHRDAALQLAVKYRMEDIEKELKAIDEVLSRLTTQSEKRYCLSRIEIADDIRASLLARGFGCKIEKHEDEDGRVGSLSLLISW